MTGSPSLSAALRRATRAQHDELDGCAFFATLEAGALDLDRFTGYLRATATLYSALGHALRGCPNDQLRALAHGQSTRLTALRHDIDALGRGQVAFAVPTAFPMTEDIRRRGRDEPASLAGFCYVMAGSTQGLPELRRRVARCFDFDDSCRHLHYLRDSEETSADHWRQFLAALNQLELDERQSEQAVEGAQAAFAHIKAVVTDLMWDTECPPRLTAEHINPAAGPHPIAQDPLVIEGAIRSGDLAWEAWPYCRRRFPHRGLAFTRSDSAWLAMLPDLPTPRVAKQVDWLANVLAARGMPSFLLAHHLDLVRESVVDVVPEQRARFEVLVDMANELRERGRAAISDTAATDLERHYRAAARPSDGDNDDLPELGLLAVNAVRDELCGRQRAVASLLEWTTAVNIGARRADAIAATVEAARAAGQSPAHTDGQ